MPYLQKPSTRARWPRRCARSWIGSEAQSSPDPCSGEVNVAHVLVVDDDADVRSLVRRVLTKLGHQVWDVADGAEVLRLLETTRCDLLITDVYMAEVDGMELLVRIQLRGLRMPVVVMSGGGLLSREDVLKVADAWGAVATLEKPFSVEQLRATVEPLLKPPAVRP
jgi:DNA-binding NtrC family response regulator